MRYVCDIEGMEGNYVEYSESWTRGEMRRFWQTDTPDEDKDAWLDLVRSKVRDIHLDTTNGAIVERDGLTEEALDDVDLRLFTWFANTPHRAAVDVAELGNAAGRRLWATSEQSKDTADRPKS